MNVRSAPVCTPALAISALDKRAGTPASKGPETPHRAYACPHSCDHSCDAAKLQARWWGKQPAQTCWQPPARLHRGTRAPVAWHARVQHDTHARAHTHTHTQCTQSAQGKYPREMCQGQQRWQSMTMTHSAPTTRLYRLPRHAAPAASGARRGGAPKPQPQSPIQNRRHMKAGGGGGKRVFLKKWVALESLQRGKRKGASDSRSPGPCTG